MSDNPDIEEAAGQLISHVPFANAIGIRIISAEKGKVTAKVPYADHLIGDPDSGIIHGGVITAMLDNVCGSSVISALPAPMAIATIDLRIDYMRPAEAGKDIFCTTECYRLTRAVAFVRGVAYTDSPDKPIAHCAGSFMLAANRSDPIGANTTASMIGEMLAKNDGDAS
ncbi:MAG: PaaI family thioesterase [Alphaproteobacteria bacterium]